MSKHTPFTVGSSPSSGTAHDDMCSGAPSKSPKSWCEPEQTNQVHLQVHLQLQDPPLQDQPIQGQLLQGPPPYCAADMMSSVEDTPLLAPSAPAKVPSPAATPTVATPAEIATPAAIPTPVAILGQGLLPRYQVYTERNGVWGTTTTIHGHLDAEEVCLRTLRIMAVVLVVLVTAYLTYSYFMSVKN